MNKDSEILLSFVIFVKIPRFFDRLVASKKLYRYLDTFLFRKNLFELCDQRVDRARVDRTWSILWTAITQVATTDRNALFAILPIARTTKEDIQRSFAVETKSWVIRLSLVSRRERTVTKELRREFLRSAADESADSSPESQARLSL